MRWSAWSEQVFTVVAVLIFFCHSQQGCLDLAASHAWVVEPREGQELAVERVAQLVEPLAPRALPAPQERA